MIDLPDCSVTETHARGLRRAEDRWVERRRASWSLQHKPRRFGPRVRSLHQLYLNVYGEGRVRLKEETKKSAVWFCVEHDDDARYRLAVRRLERRPGRSVPGYGRLALEATPHAYERFIQAKARLANDWVDLLVEIFERLRAAPGFDRDAAAEGAQQVCWRRAGCVKLHLPRALHRRDPGARQRGVAHPRR